MKTLRYSLSLLALTLFTFTSVGQQYMTGLNLDPESSTGLALYESDAFGFGGELPESTSLREYAPYPGNQGSYGTCVGWAWGYCGMTTLYARQFGLKNRNVITAMAMCPYSVFNNIRGESDSGCQNGAGLVEAGEFVTGTGTKRFHLRDSDCGTTDEVDEGLMIYQADSYTMLWDWSDYTGPSDDKGGSSVVPVDKVEAAKNALADGHIVEIGMSVCASFQDGVNDQGEWIKSRDPYDNLPGGGHAMCVLGYDDNRFGGTFEVQNSWGRDWGDDGYVYISYDDFEEYVVCGAVVELDEDNEWSGAGLKKGCVFGDCDGEYSRFTFENGDMYEGMVNNGRPEGNGIYQWVGGDVYAGEFKGGLKHGAGTYYYADGTTQKGHWKDDEYREDLAYLDYSFGRVNLGDYYWEGYANGKIWMYGSYYLDYGLKIYEGKFSEAGDPDDFGLLNSREKDLLSEFKDGMHHGYNAVFYDEDWTLYQCEDDDCNEVADSVISTTIDEIPKVRELERDSIVMPDDNCAFGDCNNGYSRYTYPSGSKYDGFVVNGWRHGYGTYTFANGNDVLSYEGEYKFGKRSGVGRLIMADGSWFMGSFEDGNAEGRGVFVKKDGTVQVGFWENGVYVEMEQTNNSFKFADAEMTSHDGDAVTNVSPALEKTPRKFGAPIQLK
ncbi:MAG: C1 family peptidase [Crocinitomicaceae bacterium]|nr:C1 family peptidase [Crocinitomicaceae bacterium]